MMLPPREGRNRRGIRVAFASLAIAIFATPVLAQAVQQGRWWIGPEGRWCYAGTRDPGEFAIAPFNTLRFAMVAGSELLAVRIHLWPGAVSDDMPAMVEMTDTGSGQTLELTAMTTGDWMVDPDHYLGEAEVAFLAKADLIKLDVSGVAKPVAFATDGLREAVATLRDCARENPG